MRVLMLARFRYDSVAGHILTLAGELNRQGVNTVVVFTGCPSDARQLCLEYSRYRAPFIAASGREEIEKIIRYYRINLVHLHGHTALPETALLSRRSNIPLVLTVHDPPLPSPTLSGLESAALIITGNPALAAPLSRYGRPLFCIPEGIDTAEYRPGQKGDFTITFVEEEGHHTRESCLALLKAAGLADLPVEVIAREQTPPARGRHHGWRPGRAAVLSGSTVVVGRRRALLEGMACGNAALIMGRNYQGPVEPKAGLPYPDLSGEGGAEPCYRNIFYDLSRLIKERAYREQLQQWSRRFVRENHDLRLAAELTARAYRTATHR